MVEQTRTALQFYYEWQQAVAVMVGMMLQFAIGDKGGAKIVATMILSTLFIALFILPAALEFARIDPGSKIANACYALSALVSVEMIALLIKVLPKAASARLKGFLGVRDDL